MNLVIDCFKLVKGVGKSIGIYNLAKSLTIKLGEKNAKLQEEAGDTRKTMHEIIVFGNARNREDFDVPGVTFVKMPGDPTSKLYCIWWELFLVMKYARQYKADRLLFPRGFAPFYCGSGNRRIKDTIIIHDLIPFFYNEQYPGYFNRLENFYIMNRLKASMRNADRIITISKCSKEDILKRASCSREKITVIHNGLNDVSFSQKVQSGDYIVAMTSALPHKNAAGVLKAYDAYFKLAQKPLELVVIGIGDASVYPEMDVEALSHVKFYKFMKNFEQMCRLVAGGRAYLFLSYAEGFGFPPLEAMQLSLPVVCSNRSSLPEVVGDAAILVDPDDLHEVAGALTRVTQDQALRQELIEKGRENIRRFSWESRTKRYWEELFG